MLHKRHLTSIVVALATALLMAGPAMAVGRFQPRGQYHVVTLTRASHGSAAPTLCSEVCSSGAGGAYWPDTPALGVSSPSGSRSSAVHVTASSNTFDWGDAGIGAGAAIVVMLLIVAARRLATTDRSRTGLAKAA